MAVQERLTFNNQAPTRHATIFSRDGLIAFARNGRTLFITGLVLGTAGVAILTSHYDRSFDESTTATSIFMVVSYVLVGRVFPLMVGEPEGDARPIPREMVPFLICMAFALICVLFVGVTLGALAIYSALNMPWAVSLAATGLTRLGLATLACIVSAVICLLIQIAITHRDRLMGEIRKAFWIFETNVRFPHLPHRF